MDDKAEASVAPDAGLPPDCKLGVLFVHGIGEQKEGETLLAFGEPLIAWMREWITGHGQRALAQPIDNDKREVLRLLRNPEPDGIEVDFASLFPSKRRSLDPPHGIVNIRIKHRGIGQKQQHQRWLLAESWWGEQVQPPPVFDLLRWMFSRGPWIAFAHAAERAWHFTHPATARPRLDVAWRVLAWPLAAALFLAVAFALQLLLLVAWVFALIPIPAVRRYVSAALQKMISILGDSYGLVANDLQRGAILTRFQDTVNWMQARCDRLVIVAHSQGTAVVHAALQASRITRPPLLLTFGSGLAKLNQLRQCELTRQVQLAGAGWIVPTALAAGLLHVWSEWGSGSEVGVLPLLYWALYAAAFGCAVGAWSSWHDTRTQPPPTTPAQPGESRRWVDLYASHDPVPQGSLAEHLPGCGIVSERIINRRSALGDHTAYWNNKSEFVTRVVAELDRQAQLLGIPDLHADADYRRATQHHRSVILTLSVAWWAIVALVVVVAWKRRDDMAAIGERVLDALADGPLSAFANTLIAVGHGLGSAVEGLTDSAPGLLAKIGHHAVATVALLLLLYLWWNLVAALLSRWDNAQLTDFLGYEKAKVWGPRGTWLVWPFVILIGVVLPVMLGWGLATNHSLWWVLLWTLSLAGGLIGLIFAVLLLLSVAIQIPRDWSTVVGIGRQVVAGLVDATTPGSDEPSSSRHGMNSWKTFVSWSLGTMAVAALLAIAADKVMTGRDVTPALFALPYALIATLMLVRLYRLVRQRGHVRWVAAALVILPLMLCAYAAGLGDPDQFHWMQRLTVAGLVVTLMTGPAYWALDRWLPARRVHAPASL